MRGRDGGDGVVGDKGGGFCLGGGWVLGGRVGAWRAVEGGGCGVNGRAGGLSAREEKATEGLGAVCRCGRTSFERGWRVGTCSFHGYL